jgi:hypothetical protein
MNERIKKKEAQAIEVGLAAEVSASCSTTL